MLPDNEFRFRRERIAAEIPPLELDALLLTNLVNVRYLTGFTGSNGLLLLTPESATLFTDPRYTLQAAQETSCRVEIVKGSTLTGLLPVIKRRKLRRLGFEHQHIAFHTHHFLKEKLALGFELKPTSALVETHRMVKSESEVARIRRAVATNSKAYERVLGRMKPGVRESDIAAELEHQMRRFGAEGPSFDTIVASGPHAALPHYRPAASPIGADQLLLIDMGATQDGYTSDMTRTVFFGTPSRDWKKRYQAVLDAQLASIAAVRPGVPASKIDQAARQVLKTHGLDQAFTHSTGHGLGLEIHEGPRLGRKEKTKLKAGMVITIEPGVYLEGDGGIRIEDTVLVTESGCEVLTPTSKDLTIV